MILYGVILFGIIYFAVRLAIEPLIQNGKKERETTEDDVDLIMLRDLDVLSVEELNDIYNFYSEQELNNKSNQQLKRYTEALEELKKVGYFSEEEYLVKVERLKDTFK